MCTGQPAEIGVLPGHPGHTCDRSLPAQELLDGCRDDGRVLDDLPALVGILGQKGEEALQRVGNRVEAGDEKQEADAEDLVIAQPIATDLGQGEHAEEILLRALPPFGQGLGKEALDLGRADPLVGLDLIDVIAFGAQDAVFHP